MGRGALEHSAAPLAEARLFPYQARDDLTDVRDLAPAQFENIGRARHLLLLSAAIFLLRGSLAD
jgi:hypothetical protein